MNDGFIQWVDESHGGDKTGRVMATRGKKHNHLGMALDHSTNGEVKVDVTHCIDNMIEQLLHQPKNFWKFNQFFRPV